ncbi:MAG: helix-turn-helix transcriptional regulator [Coriobacteriales bacterium]|nr:helix-turn-helix transcriptional regulator [Coriobacteriales bacterium]
MAEHVLQLNPFRDFTRKDALLTLACMLALGLILLVSSLTTSVSFAAYRTYGLSRNLRAVFSAFWYIIFAIISYYRLKQLSGKRIVIIVTAATLLWITIFVLTVTSGTFEFKSPVLCGIGLFLFAFVYSWMNYLFACSLLRLVSLKAAAICVTGGVILRQLASPLYTGLSQSIAILAAGIISIILIAALAYLSIPIFESISSGETLSDLELTNPLSSLRPPLKLFICTFIISFTYNFSNNLGVPQPSLRRFLVVFILLFLLYYLLIQKDEQEDRLFSLVVLFIMAGLLTAPLLLTQDTFLAHTFFFLGSSCFTILIWLLLYGLGTRSFVSMAPVTGLLLGLDSLGQFFGGTFGGMVIPNASQDLLGAQAAILSLALAFFLFIWLGFKSFSFTAAIRGIETVHEVKSPLFLGVSSQLDISDDAEKTSHSDTASEDAGGNSDETSADLNSRELWLNNRCKELAENAALTPREFEILSLLAHGRNAAYIMDALTISRNTAKAHIKHIYTKLDVHSHQELLSLVESEL